MALKKDLILDNGIVLTYHRIVSVNTITNQISIIEVASYLNQEQRQKEKDWYETNGKDSMNVYINTTYHSKEYDKDLNVDTAYEYLKTLDMFEGAEDILEESTEEEEIIPEENIQEEIIEEEITSEESENIEEEIN